MKIKNVAEGRKPKFVQTIYLNLRTWIEILRKGDMTYFVSLSECEFFIPARLG